MYVCVWMYKHLLYHALGWNWWCVFLLLVLRIMGAVGGRWSTRQYFICSAPENFTWRIYNWPTCNQRLNLVTLVLPRPKSFFSSKASCNTCYCWLLYHFALWSTRSSQTVKHDTLEDYANKGNICIYRIILTFACGSQCHFILRWAGL